MTGSGSDGVTSNLYTIPKNGEQMTLAPCVRILADDLTGALDTAAQFSACHGAMPVSYTPCEQSLTGTGSVGYDCATRDRSAQYAENTATEMASFFHGANIAMRKVDTLLRGHAFLEIALSYRLGGFHSCIVAPAYPAQGRTTQDGRQLVLGDSGLVDVAGPLADRLIAHGIKAKTITRAQQISGDGVFVCDASTQADLDAIVAAGRRLRGPVLWCGAAGLAKALGGGSVSRPLPGPPSLMIIGSRHPRSLAQLKMLATAMPTSITTLVDPTEKMASPFANGLTVWKFEPSGTPAHLVTTAIATAIQNGLKALAAPPSCLIASGGETLRCIAEARGASGMTVVGEIEEGVPLSVLSGGCWNGMPVVSKSGAFGDDGMLVRLAGSTYQPKGGQFGSAQAATGEQS